MSKQFEISSLPQVHTHEFDMSEATKKPIGQMDFEDDFANTTQNVVTIDNNFLLESNSYYIDANKATHVLCMGDETYRFWIDKAKKMNDKSFGQFGNFIINKYQTRDNEPIIVIEGDKFKYKDSLMNEDQIKLLMYYIFKKMDSKVNDKYSILYISKDNSLPLSVIQSVLSYFPNKYRKNLNKIFLLLLPTFGITFKTSIWGKEDMDKIVIVKSLYELYEYLPVGLYQFPSWVIDTYTREEHKIFGVPLKEAVTTNYRGISDIPFVVECAIQYLSTANGALSTEGIFRVSGNKEQVDAYCKNFDHCKICSFSKDESPHLVSTLLRRYLQKLPEPVLTNQLGSIIIETFEHIEDDKAQQDKHKSDLKELIKKLPLENRKLLLSILNLGTLIAMDGTNKMDKKNISTIFGQCLYWKNEGKPSVDELTGALANNDLFVFMMDNIYDFVDVLTE
ncbi:MAG: hypothetical protein MR354_08325 [Bacteroides xylanisolvens]|nr:hypothetical protein [Bacteroides xylanisolvens]